MPVKCAGNHQNPWVIVPGLVPTSKSNQNTLFSEVPRAFSPPKEEVPANEIPPLRSLWHSDATAGHALQALRRASEVEVKLKEV
jgi:hypothetical protein